ncbi:hypothetical protein HPB47_025938 [Ixodes persulcatus]|uniref:Uncharacterized protein n=1 Tax=Ixodes persulcatus TaxID=34615 RepID=A0AC60Q0S2_IXOPE|nr:hypothetical protein HPB47_025938 [Ixodes persulcatus]
MEGDDDQEWPLPGATQRKRKRNPLTPEDAEASKAIPQPTQTVVLRSIGRKAVNAFTGQDIFDAVKQAGIQSNEQYTVRRNEKANAIAITTRDPLTLEKLLKVKEIRKGTEVHQLQPYKAMAGNECRGVLYLQGEGNEVTAESLQADIVCKSHKVVAARPMGPKGNTILVTFEGRVLPKKVSYMSEVLNVREYRPRPLVCFRCHAIGHKMDVCPRDTARCGTCGSEHDGMEGCAQTPKCRNCGGAHVATSKECPQRAIPPRRNNQKPTAGKDQGQEQPRPTAPAAPAGGGTSYAAKTTGSIQPKTPPVHQSQQAGMMLQTLHAQQAGPQKVPEDTADFDLSEVKREERAARKARLTTLLPANPHRIPSSFPRWERVALNRLQTKTVLTPVWLSRIYHPTDPDDVGPDPNCEHCGVPATCSHLMWDCAESAPEREAAIRSLPYHIRPCSYTEWTKPTTAILHEQNLIYTSLIDFLRSSGIASAYLFDLAFGIECILNSISDYMLISALSKRKLTHLHLTCDDEDKDTFPTLVKALALRLASAGQRAVSAAQFRSRGHQPTEALDVYAYDVVDLFGQAYPEMPLQVGDPMIQDQFIVGLQSKLRDKVLAADPVTFENALEIASRLTSIGQLSATTGTPILCAAVGNTSEATT